MSAVSHWLNRSLHVWRPTVTADGSGGYTETLEPVNTDPDESVPTSLPVSVKVDQSTAAEQTVAQQAGGYHSHNIYAEADEDIRRNDRLAPTGVNPNTLAAGDTFYKVISTTTPSTPRYLKCAAERIEHG